MLAPSSSQFDPEVAATDELSLRAPDQGWLALLSASLLVAEVV